ncbi:MAG: glycosyltransferase [Nitrospirales bacterium]|nr:glycosyltransferase [Nitrospirales bacterium]
MRKIKIAYVIDRIDSPTAGTEKQLLLLLKSLDRSRYAPVLCLLRSSEWVEKVFDVCPVRIVDIRSFRDPRSYGRIGRFAAFLRQEGVGIVQTHFRDAHIAALLAARLAGVRIVIAARRNQGYWLTRRELSLQRFLNRWVTLFLANSLSTKKWSMDTEGIPDGKIRVVHNGIDPDFYGAVSGEARRRHRSLLALPPDAPVVGIVSNLRPVKGVDVFLRAAQAIRREVPGTHFVVVGDGGERKGLERLSRGPDLAGSVHFLGKRDDVPSLLSAFDVGVLSSRSESFSNALIEYSAAGLPVVATDVGGAREAVVQGVNGFIVPPGDPGALAGAVVRILTGKALARYMGERGRERAQELFSLRRFVEETEKVYHSCWEGVQRR